jgi:UDP-2-acetamido-2,6-beta-L-arabino-hexul-4-ose reductase
MRLLVTGSNGFVGRNLCVRLRELGYENIFALSRATPIQDIAPAVAAADFVFHIAGVNRPRDPAEFSAGNVDFTASLCRAILDAGKSTPIVYTSSVQAAFDNPYGRSKAAAEDVLKEYGRRAAARVHILRLNNLFGKWSRPNYNSVVSTYCHNIARDLPIRIDNAAAPISLVYIDDVVNAMVAFLESSTVGDAAMSAVPVYETTVGGIAAMIRAFKESRETLVTEPVGEGFVRALYATYVSYFPIGHFAYPVAQYSDPRGTFVEMLKTRDSGQFSYFSAHPGTTRGGHYHHSKTEKFLVIRGNARFRFRHIVTDEQFELRTSGEMPQIVETVPGWSHDITNIGDDEMIVMLWANEIFDRQRPDTHAFAV